MSKMPTYRAHYIPNSHLDREWTLDFQHTRALTVQFIDNLLEILGKVRGYQFLMDSQTLPLEDYLAVRPEREALVRTFVKAGRLHIGPWYSAPDMNTLDGESIVRNLLVGHRIAQDFGRVMKVGYTPFGFVHISQLPQIYVQFGIDTCFFYRGIPPLERSEFIWEGADGTRVLASRMSKQPRFNYYWHVWRKGLYHDQPARLDRTCDWRSGQMPFRLCDEATRFDHGAILRPRRHLDRAVVEQELHALFERERQTFGTPELAFMHGFDTSAPEMLEDEVLRLCQGLTQSDETLFYSSMPEYAESLKAALAGRTLPVFKGEMKYPEVKPSGFHQTFVNTVSTRSRQKILTTRVENLLLRAAEPFAAVADILGQPWPGRYLDLAWREFLKCHPHDTIGGCGIDAIEEDCTYRLRQTESIAKCLLKSSLGTIMAAIDTHGLQRDDILLTLFNPSPFAREEVVTCYVDIPRELGMRAFTVVDPDGRAIPFTARATGNHGKVFRDPNDLALFSNADEYEVRLHATALPALGYRSYVVRAGQPAALEGTLVAGERQMENEHLKVTIRPDGSVDVVQKATGHTFPGLHVFEDVGEAGHPWMHIDVKRDQRITSAGLPARIRVVEDTALRASFEVALTMMVPATTRYDLAKRYHALPEEDSWRTDERAPLAIRSVFTLERGARSLAVETTVDNQARNHRLRLLFPTGLQAETTFADNPFDVIERPIRRDEHHPLRGIRNIDYPFLKFVGLSDAHAGFAFAGMGLKEYEALDDEKRTLGITLFRAVENWLCTTNVWDRVPGDLMQCLGSNRYQYRLCFFGPGGWSRSDVRCQAEQLNHPVIPCLAGVEAGGMRPLSGSFMEIDNPVIVLSGFKRAEDGVGHIVRVYNPSGETAAGSLHVLWPASGVEYVNMNEESQGPACLEGESIRLVLAPKKVVSLRIRSVASTPTGGGEALRPT